MKRTPKFLAVFTGLYIVWSLVPVLIAVLFSFNAGRSRSTWQGFSTVGTGVIRSRPCGTTRRCGSRSATASCSPC